MLSGFWLPTLLLLLWLLSGQGLLPGLVVGLTLCLWIAHRLSSLYLALCLPEYRQVLAHKSRYFWHLPLLFGVGLFGFLLAPEHWLPLSRLQRFLLLLGVDYFFALYHFSVQHYGVLAVYRGKLPHGQRDPSLLRWDWWICLGVSGGMGLLMDLLNGELHLLLFGQLPAQPFSSWLVWGLRAGLSVAVLLIWGLTFQRYQRGQQGRARLLYFSTLCYLTLVSFYVPPLLYFAIIQVQHWLVALGLTSYMAQQSGRLNASAQPVVRQQPAARLARTWQAASLRWYGFWQAVNARSWGPLLALVLLSICLTPILEADYFIGQHFDPETLVVKNFLTHFQGSIWLYLFGALALYSSFLHYLYDRGVYRFSDPLTRQAALHLLQPRQGQGP